MMQSVCRVEDLPDPGTKEFRLAGGLEVFVVRKGEYVFAYENSCPHTGVTLNWLPDRFLDRGAETIQCDVHGARFRIEDGACLFGPCAGRGLTPVPVHIEQGEVVLGLPD